MSEIEISEKVRAADPSPSPRTKCITFDRNLEDEDLVVHVKDTDLGAGLKTCWKNSRAPAAVLMCAAIILVALPAAFQHGAPARQNTSSGVGLLVVGDWGRMGSDHQKTCANAMAATAAELREELLGPRAADSTACDDLTSGSFVGVISTGDNFYDDGVTPADFQTHLQGSFSNVYSHPALRHLPWASVMGNHDYHGHTDVQIGVEMRESAGTTECGPRWDAMRSGYREYGGGAGGDAAGSPVVGVCFVDTSPWVWSYRNATEKYRFDGLIGDDPGRASETWRDWEDDQIKSLEQCLLKSRASWKIVVGHHGIVSYSEKHGSQPELIRVRLALERLGAIAYLNGHDHNLQHVVPTKTANTPGAKAVAVRYITTGAGSKLRDDVDLANAPPKGDGSLYFQTGTIPGFVAVRASHAKIVFEHRGGDRGEVLYSDAVVAR